MKAIIITVLLILGVQNTVQAQIQGGKHDLGIRVSSFDQERFQLNYRYHKNEKWTFQVTGQYGSSGNSYYNEKYSLQDSTNYEISVSGYSYDHYGLSIGLRRNLSFMKHNYYYVGAGLGGGYTELVYSSFSALYEVEPSSDSYPVFGDLLESEDERQITKGWHSTARIYTGLDIPILDRLSLNLELGILNNLTGMPESSWMSNTIYGYVSGGLHFNIGKSDSENDTKQ